MSITIRDVAKLANTSVTAVSATMSKNPSGKIRVSSETRERILAAASQLGYSPNRVAQSLASGKTGVIGLVFPYSHAFVDQNPFCTQVLSGVMEEAVKERYNLMLHTAVGDDWNAADEAALLDPRVDGLLVVLPAPHSRLVDRCQKDNFPCVSLVYHSDHENVYTVNAEEVTGGRLATQHLLEAGHRRIAHISGLEGIASTEARLQGYLQALREAGCEKKARTIAGTFEQKGGYAAMNQLLDLPPHERPTAVFACNDLCAAGALEAVAERGLSVPDDIALVGYDDTWFATMTSPPLTSIHLPIREMAMCAAEMLIGLVEGKKPSRSHPVLPVTLTLRASSKKPPVC